MSTNASLLFLLILAYAIALNFTCTDKVVNKNMLINFHLAYNNKREIRYAVASSRKPTNQCHFIYSYQYEFQFTASN